VGVTLAVRSIAPTDGSAAVIDAADALRRSGQVGKPSGSATDLAAELRG